jgi:hypothetical protein
LSDLQANAVFLVDKAVLAAASRESHSNTNVLVSLFAHLFTTSCDSSLSCNLKAILKACFSLHCAFALDPLLAFI